ncbi:MAG TPA: DUF1361 domain-containing protein [Acidimicrobiales bacterium]|nr:DUF1361 domain-containing protein [Acidimicrobiales bacterium]HKH23925.1 DUF1361 domain-containing protein [Acidimicrobiales bacterium]
MYTLELVAGNIEEVVHSNALWMGWNLCLAAVPVGLAFLVFRHRGRRNPPWWAGLGLFALFLPNAPYVITDLVHLRGDVVGADDDAAVITGVLPVYAAFIVLGVLAYTVSLILMGNYLDRVGLASRRAAIEVGVHAVTAVGVVLGRFARLNSWEPVTEPHTTLERIVLTLTARWAVVAVLGMFAVTWLAHAVMRSVVEAAWRRGPSALRGLVTARP